jgi:hypothetical protein
MSIVLGRLKLDVFQHWVTISIEGGLISFVKKRSTVISKHSVSDCMIRRKLLIHLATYEAFTFKELQYDFVTCYSTDFILCGIRSTEEGSFGLSSRAVERLRTNVIDTKTSHFIYPWEGAGADLAQRIGGPGPMAIVVSCGAENSKEKVGACAPVTGR